jgi:hypothetical protein
MAFNSRFAVALIIASFIPYGAFALNPKVIGDVEIQGNPEIRSASEDSEKVERESAEPTDEKPERLDTRTVGV